MRYQIITVLVIGLYGCSVGEIDALANDLQNNRITTFSYKVSDIKTFECNPLVGQDILKQWSASFNEAGIASWPSPDNYIVLLFENGHRYNIKTFIGTNKLEYSVIYSDDVYTGEKLRLESVCPGLKAHNKSFNQVGAKIAPSG